MRFLGFITSFLARLSFGSNTIKMMKRSPNALNTVRIFFLEGFTKGTV
jgi:hypothetical protein